MKRKVFLIVVLIFQLLYSAYTWLHITLHIKPGMKLKVVSDRLSYYFGITILIVCIVLIEKLLKKDGGIDGS